MMIAQVIDLATVRARRVAQASERAAVKAATLATAQVQAQAGRWADALTEPLPTPPAAKVVPPPTSPPLVWRESKRGNWWAKDAASGFHVVIYETSRGWSGRATPEGGDGFYLNGLRADTLKEAQRAVELWLRERDGGGAADPASNPHR